MCECTYGTLNSRVEDGRWQSRGATVAQNRFRGMSLMRLLIQSRGCGGMGLWQTTGSNEDEDEDENSFLSKDPQLTSSR